MAYPDSAPGKCLRRINVGNWKPGYAFGMCGIETQAKRNVADLNLLI